MSPGKHCTFNWCFLLSLFETGVVVKKSSSSLTRFPTGLYTNANEHTFSQRSCITNYASQQYLSHDVAVIQWITSCHKNRMATRVITLWRVYVTSLTTSASTMCLQIELMFILEAIKSHFKVVICGKYINLNKITKM